MKNKIIKGLMTTVKIALGALFIYAGIQKFNPTPRPQPASYETNLPEHVVKMKELIGGMKKSGYFWEMVGIAEMVCGILLVSQLLAVLGAVMLVPITLNIFLFHAVLEPHDIPEFLMTGMYLMANLAILVYHYPQLKRAFISYNETQTYKGLETL